MKVAVLARGLDRPGGVRRLLMGYLSHLPAAAPDWSFYAITDSALPPGASAPNLTEVRLPKTNAALFDHVRASKASREIGADVFLATKNSVPFGLSCPAVCVYLDLAYFARPQSYSVLDNLYMRAMFRRSGRQAERIIAISHSTCEDVNRFLGNEAAAKTVVVHPGVSERFRVYSCDELRGAARELEGLPKRFILYAGNISPRKNLARLLEASGALGGDVALVITGHRRWKSRAFDQALKRAGKHRKVVVLGGVQERMLPALYNLAEAAVYPSLYEGFGFPVLEAFACGTPVAASNASSIPEAAGEAALMFEPTDVGEMA